jgi:L-iditol 2-dehydrogenase
MIGKSVQPPEGMGAPAGDPRMRVYHLVRPGELSLQKIEIPVPSDGEVLARVDVALTCGTDLKTLERGHARLKVPGPLGHEWAGTVETLGAGVRGVARGDRVVATPTAPCGDCAFCLRSEENLCLHLFEQMALGAYGEYVLVPRHIVNRNMFVIPDGVSSHQAAFLEPLACTVHGADLLSLTGDRTVVFLGDGPISLLFIQVARLRGAGRIVLVGRHSIRLEVGHLMGADVVLNVREVDVRGAVEALTDGLGADTVVECVGHPEAWSQAMGLVRRGGEVLFFGGCERGQSVRFDTERIHYDEITLRGGFHLTPDSVLRAWELITTGRLNFDAIVTHRMRLEELPAAFDLMRRREALKVAISP